MVKLNLRSPFRHDQADNQGRRRSQRIQQQQLRKQQEQIQERQRLEASMNDGASNQRTSPGQRRSFDDINNAPAGSSQVLRRIFSNTSNKKSRRSTSAAGRNSKPGTSGGGVIRSVATMFRPSSSVGRRETGATTLLSSGAGSFETLEVMDTSQNSFPRMEDCDMTVEDVDPVLAWMQTDAPPDVLPKILSFCGSRKVNALSRVNKAWNKIITSDDLIWREMCEDTHKLNQGEDVPDSWLEHYKENPCLPFDYDSIDAAFEAISFGSRKKVKEHSAELLFRVQRKSARILLQPGPYFLRRSLVCNVIGDAQIKIECVVGQDPKHGMMWSRNYNKSSDYGQPTIPRTSSILKVNRPSASHLTEVFAAGCLSPNPVPRHNFNESSMSDIMEGIMKGNYPLSCVEGENPTAFLIFEAKHENEPCVRVRQGSVTLRGLKFLHYAHGKDIWNGNTAIQVQGPFNGNQPISIRSPSIAPTANVIDCDIQSLSGRGMVSIDGGIARVDRCNIHNCAATGLYLGGLGSAATITCSDIYENGNGNDRRRREGEQVTRGHSGVYVEQGIARIRDCNISKNSLTGMSGIHQDKATLQIENSDIVSNGSVQLELPPQGSVSRGRSFSRGNNISAFPGTGQPRSRHLRAILRPERTYSGPIGNQWEPVFQSPSQFPMDNVARTAPSAIRVMGN